MNAPKCGRKFFTKEKLETHIKLRHPLLSFPPSSINNTKDSVKTDNINNSNINTNINKIIQPNQPIQNNNLAQENNKNEQKLQIKETKIDNNNNILIIIIIQKIL